MLYFFYFLLFPSNLLQINEILTLPYFLGVLGGLQAEQKLKFAQASAGQFYIRFSMELGKIAIAGFIFNFLIYEKLF